MTVDFYKFKQAFKDINLEKLYMESPKQYDNFINWYLENFTKNDFYKGEDLQVNLEVFEEEGETDLVLKYWEHEDDAFEVHLPVDMDDEDNFYELSIYILNLYVITYRIAKKLDYPALLAAVDKINVENFEEHLKILLNR